MEEKAAKNAIVRDKKENKGFSHEKNPKDKPPVQRHSKSSVEERQANRERERTTTEAALKRKEPELNSNKRQQEG